MLSKLGFELRNGPFLCVANGGEAVAKKQVLATYSIKLHVLEGQMEKMVYSHLHENHLKKNPPFHVGKLIPKFSMEKRHGEVKHSTALLLACCLLQTASNDPRFVDRLRAFCRFWRSRDALENGVNCGSELNGSTHSVYQSVYSCISYIHYTLVLSLCLFF